MMPVDGAVRVPGGWIPLALMMGVFAVKFVLGAAKGMHSPVLGELSFVVAISIILGLLSGRFAARALAVHRFAGQGE